MTTCSVRRRARRPLGPANKSVSASSRASSRRWPGSPPPRLVTRRRRTRCTIQRQSMMSAWILSPRPTSCARCPRRRVRSFSSPLPVPYPDRSMRRRRTSSRSRWRPRDRPVMRYGCCWSCHRTGAWTSACSSSLSTRDGQFRGCARAFLGRPDIYSMTSRPLWPSTRRSISASSARWTLRRRR